MLIIKNCLLITSQEKWINITTKTLRKVEIYSSCGYSLLQIAYSSLLYDVIQMLMMANVGEETDVWLFK